MTPFAATPSGPDARSFALVVVAAGNGQRFGGEVPKQFARIGGKTVLRHTLEAFLRCGPDPENIRIVIDPAHERLYREAVSGLALQEPVPGGKERKDSVYNALLSLAHLPENYPVLIHDAARPCISVSLIETVVAALCEHKAVSPAVPVSDTLRRLDRGTFDETINRSQLWALQTPQGFHYSTILQAHEAARHTPDITDDTGVVSAYGEAVHLVEGSRANLKITAPEDLPMAAALLSSPVRVTRVGMGYDVHVLIPGDGTIRLGGIDIPHDKKLSGHSDADVVLHAITDALLGTIAAGDIGTHFPPSDAGLKGMDSTLFLRKAQELVQERQGDIVHIDLTIMGEQPKISPYREKMQARIAGLLALPLAAVSIKATTTEKLGFTGREEGLVAQAVATVSFAA